jgi:Ca2+:H+ antiporter
LSVIPALVLLGWAMDRPLDLQFEAYEAAAMFATCVLVSIITSQGQTNWLQGLVLVTAYVLIAAGFLVHA